MKFCMIVNPNAGKKQGLAASKKAAKIELNIDGKPIKRKAVFVEICNSKYTGGDMMMAPDAEIDDGLLDIIILNKVSRRKLLSLFPLLFKGAHVKTTDLTSCDYSIFIGIARYYSQIRKLIISGRLYEHGFSNFKIRLTVDSNRRDCVG